LALQFSPNSSWWYSFFSNNFHFLHITCSIILLTETSHWWVAISWQYDESRSQELIERKIKNAPPDQGKVRMLSREEWEKIRELPPRTPFESKFSRPNSRIRTGEPLRLVSISLSLFLLLNSH
jgi:hypothetical protein